MREQSELQSFESSTDAYTLLFSFNKILLPCSFLLLGLLLLLDILVVSRDASINQNPILVAFSNSVSVSASQLCMCLCVCLFVSSLSLSLSLAYLHLNVFLLPSNSLWRSGKSETKILVACFSSVSLRLFLCFCLVTLSLSICFVADFLILCKQTISDFFMFLLRSIQIIGHERKNLAHWTVIMQICKILLHEIVDQCWTCQICENRQMLLPPPPSSFPDLLLSQWFTIVAERPEIYITTTATTTRANLVCQSARARTHTH